MRRSRYTVTTQRQGVGVEKHVALSYESSSARDYFERRGYVVLTVTKGDYRREASKAIERARADGKWDFNLRAIRTAFEAMTGTALPAELRFEKGRRSTQQEGCFEASVIAGPVVRIRRTLDPEAANVALWHELAHVAQYTRAPSLRAWVHQSKAENRARLGYHNRPSEREAREWEVLAETDWLLTGQRP